MATKKAWYVYGEGSIFSSGETFYSHRVFKVFGSFAAAESYLNDLRQNYSNQANTDVWERCIDSFDIEETEYEE